jgi:class 3 adenylate cyclase
LKQSSKNPIKKIGTVLFCDIRNFTLLFEQRDPMEAVEFANNVLAKLGSEVEKYNGTVDRFTGDGFLAHFGILNDKKHHVENACRSAIAMRSVLTQINNRRYFDVQPVLSFGIGIHSGDIAYGRIETGQFVQKTIMGNVVNTASRVEGLTKYFTVDILLSEKSYSSVKDLFAFKPMSPQKVKGKQTLEQTYWLLPTNFDQIE